jgi:hypothetical protein
MPGKRSDPIKLRRDREAIVRDMEQRLPPDTEDPESTLRRAKKFGMPPEVSGGIVNGTKKGKNTA